jgi:hypothetical protein
MLLILGTVFLLQGWHNFWEEKGVCVTVVRLDEFVSVELKVGLDDVLAEFVSADQTLPRQVAHGAWGDGAGRCSRRARDMNGRRGIRWSSRWSASYDIGLGRRRATMGPAWTDGGLPKSRRSRSTDARLSQPERLAAAVETAQAAVAGRIPQP